MGKRSRKARTGARPRPATPPSGGANGGGDGGDRMARGYARSRARNDAVRAGLEPLAPGERPRAVTVAAVFAAVAAVANVIATALSDPTGPEWRFGAIQCGVLLAAAIGMWRVKYWAVLGFQALLGITVILAFLALLRAGNAWAAILVLAIIAVCSAQFWFLIRAMARIQMPER